MQINFFAEFPNDQDLAAADRVDWDTTVFIAANDVDAFKEYAAEFTEKNAHIAPGYWPKIKESYWISPFMPQDEIFRVQQELSELEDGTKLLFDLEPPLLTKSLFLKHLLQFRQNKQHIKQLFRTAAATDLDVYTAEFCPTGGIGHWFLTLLGLSYDQEAYGHTMIPMAYASMSPDWLHALHRRYLRTHNAAHVGLGTIATGALGDEPILSPDALAEDLQFCADHDIENIWIFRLGGLNDAYLDVIQSYI